MHSKVWTIGDGDVDVVGAPRVLVGYLCDPAAVAGSGVLFEQLDLLERYAGRALDAICVDSGRPDGPPACGHHLMRLILEAEAFGVPRIVVATVSALGPDEHLAEGALDRLVAAGVSVHDASTGKVHRPCDAVGRHAQGRLASSPGSGIRPGEGVLR